MNAPFKLTIEPPKAITSSQELALLQQALAQNPSSAFLLNNVASLLLVADRFDETIAILQKAITDKPSFAGYEVLSQAFLSRETEADTRLALQASESAFDLAESDNGRGAALASSAKALARLGALDAAEEKLNRALEFNPHDRNAYKRLASLHLRRQQPNDVLVLADRLLAKGVAHSRLLASTTLALARLGQIDEAHQSVGLDQFLHRGQLSAPAGWDNIAAFNADLASELLKHPALRFDRYGTASSKTWRIDEPGSGNPPHVAALQKQIAAEVSSYVANIGHINHPWAQAMPKGGIFHNWCVITEGNGFEEWHVHQHGWLSGVYYVAVPEGVVAGSDDAGCIAFGLPEDLVGDAAAELYGLEVTRPKPGLLMLFPSHTYHRTFAHGQPGHRICFAFDIWPV
jgi:tetratricopeptide (TPR) repeat protein